MSMFPYNILLNPYTGIISIFAFVIHYNNVIAAGILHKRYSECQYKTTQTLPLLC